MSILGSNEISLFQVIGIENELSFPKISGPIIKPIPPPMIEAGINNS